MSASRTKPVCWHGGLTVLIPDHDDRRVVDDIIFQELCLGEFREESREDYRRVVTALVQRGAEGILLGCTELRTPAGVARSART